MKIITAAIAVAGCVASWSIYAGQVSDQATTQIRQLEIEAGSAADDGLNGLFGAYPANRDASGTAWQPDSTPADTVTNTGLYASDTLLISSPEGGKFSFPKSDAVLMTRAALGPGTLGLQSSVSSYTLGEPEALSESDRRATFYSVRGSGDRVRMSGIAASYSLPVGNRISLFGYFGLPGEPALGPPVSYMRRLSGVDNPEAGRTSHWLDSSGNGPRVFTVGYAWNALKLEGSAFSGRTQEERTQAGRNVLKLDSTSTRLSYNPSPNWSFQFSRGTLSGLDQLAPDEEVRRVTVSATYNRVLANGNWQSTFAWGRNARKSREPSMGYLLESTLRFSDRHAVFGRLEQVGSGELVAGGGAAMSRTFKLNRVTFGYFHENGVRGPVKVDTGIFVNRYVVPSSAAPVYANDPASFMLFVRLNLR